MVTENLKTAIKEWQKEVGQKRAILVIAIEEKERKEDEMKCEVSLAVLGSHRMLVEAVKSTKMDGGVAAQIFAKADMSILLDKLCR